MPIDDLIARIDVTLSFLARRRQWPDHDCVSDAKARILELETELEAERNGWKARLQALRAEKAEAECDELRRESAHKLAALARPAFDERDAAQERVRKLEAAIRDVVPAGAAKRIVAEACVRRALEQFEETKSTGGAMTSGRHSGFQVAMHLLRHAADQLRISEGGD